MNRFWGMTGLFAAWLVIALINAPSARAGEEAEAPSDETRMQMPDMPHATAAQPQSEISPQHAEAAPAPGKDSPEMEDYGPATLHAALSPGGVLKKDKEASFTLRLADSHGKPVTEDGLALRHTRKLHLLVIDEGLTDYQHVHPQASPDGSWHFSFTPKTAHSYLLWADVAPLGGAPQVILMMREGESPCGAAGCVDETASLKAGTAGLKAALRFDESTLQAGKPARAELVVTDAGGKERRDLEPVMGAYAHVAAFTSAPFAVAHVHPLGAEPKAASDRGASPLSFMLHPARPGFLRIFVQLCVGGQEIFLPFGVKVGP